MKNKCYILVISLCCLTQLVFPQGSWTKTSLSAVGWYMGTASVGSKIWFAGGSRWSEGALSSLVEIYDCNTGKWTYDNLSVARDYPAGVSCGSKVFFAGGADMYTGKDFETVDIFDTITRQWTKTALSEPRFSIAAVGYGNQVLFAGGANRKTGKSFSVVDIYSLETGTWSVAHLSEARAAMAYALGGNKAVFAGGFLFGSVSNKVDIYDFKTKSWSTDTLSLARGFLSATAVGNKVIIAGGMTSSGFPTDRVDIYDTETGKWSISHLSKSRAFENIAATVCGKAFFVGGGKIDLSTQGITDISDIVDIYDPVSGNWQISHVSQPLVLHAVCSSGNQLLVAGGTDNSDVFKNVDIYTCQTAGLEIITAGERGISLYPNPVTDRLHINLPQQRNSVQVILVDPAGRVIREKKTSSGAAEIDVQGLSKGVYIIQVYGEGLMETRKIAVN